MAMHKHGVHVITRYSKNFKKQDKDIFFHFINVPIPQILLRYKFFQIIETCYFQIGVFIKSIRLLKKIDLIEAPDAAAEGFWIATLLNKKLITRIHTPIIFCSLTLNQKPSLSRKILGWMEYIQIKRSKDLSCPSYHLTKVILTKWKLPKNIKVIPNPINVDYKPKKINLIKTILFIGGFDCENGFKIFKNAFLSVKKKYPLVNAYAAGHCCSKNNNRDELMIAKLGIVKQNILFDHIKSADVVILASRWENFSYVLLESMMLKTIVICPKTGGYLEIIENGKNGIFFDIKSCNDLAKKIKYFFDMKKNTRGIIENHAFNKAKTFSSQKLYPAFMSYYLSLTKGSN